VPAPYRPDLPTHPPIVHQRTPPSNLPCAGDRPPRCLLPLPPALALPGARTRGTAYVYGFAVHEDLLADLAHHARPRARLDGVQATYAGLALVRARTGAAGAFLAAGRPDTAKTSAKARGVVPLVAVCTSAPGSYRRRPSQDVLDRLAALLGGAPRWWETYVPALGERVEDVVCAAMA
jgi:hypothetical protein